MKKLFKTLTVLVVSGTMALANPNPETFKVGMYNVKGTHAVKIFLKKQDEASLQLIVKNAKGRIIYDTAVGRNAQEAALLLNLEHLETGDYTIEISDGNTLFKKDIELVKEVKEELKIVI